MANDGEVRIGISADETALEKSLQDIADNAAADLEGAIQKILDGVEELAHGAFRLGNELSDSLSDASDSAEDFSDNAEDAAEAMDDAADASGDMADGVRRVGKESKDSGKKVKIFGDVLKANLLSDVIMGGLRKLGDALKNVASGLIEGAASYQASMSAYTQIMGDYLDEADAKLNAVAENTGVHTERMREEFTQLTAKFKGLGYDVGDATSLAERGLSLAADAAAFCDASLEDAAGSLNSFINGSYEGGEAIKLFANDTQMAQYAVQQGIVASTAEWSKLDEATKQATRLEYAENLYAQSGALGQAARESSEWANVTANLKSEWDEFLAKVGSPILEELIPVVKELSDKFTEMTENVDWDAFGEKVGKVLGAIADLMLWMIDHSEAVGAALGIIAAGFLAVSAAASPLTLLAVSVAALITETIVLKEKIEDVTGLNIPAWAAGVLAALAGGPTLGMLRLKEATEDAEKTATGWKNTHFKAAQDVATASVETSAAIAAALSNAKESIKTAWSNVPTFFAGVWQDIKDAFSNALTDFLQIGRDIIEGIKQGILEKLQAVKDAAQTVVDAIKGIFTGKKGFDTHSPSKWAEEIGRFVVVGLSNGLDAARGIATRSAQKLVGAVKTEINGLVAATDEANRQLTEQIKAIDAAAAARQEAKELSDYNKKIEDLYAQLGTASADQRQKVLDQIADAQYDWNEKQLKKQEDAQKALLQAQIEANSARLREEQAALEQFSDAYQKHLEQYIKDYEDALDKVQDAQSDLAEKLAGADLYSLNKNGGVRLEYFDDEVKAITAWQDTITALRGRGIESGILSEVLEMDMETATEYGKKLLSLADGKWNEYMAGFREKEKAAQDAAEAVYGPQIEAMDKAYVEGFPAAVKDASSQAMADMADTITEDGAAAVEAMAGVADDLIAELERVNYYVRMRDAANYVSGSLSSGLSGAATNAAEREEAVRRAALSGTAAVIGAVGTAVLGVKRDVVLKINDTELARTMIDPIRDADEQSPRIVSDR